MADWEDSGHAQQGDLSRDRAGSLVGKNAGLAQTYWSRAQRLQHDATAMVAANKGRSTTQTDKMYAKAALNRDRALSLGYEVTPGQTTERRPDDRRFTAKRPKTNRRVGGTDVGTTGGPPSGGPTRGNGKLF